MSETDLCRLCANYADPVNSGKLFKHSQRTLLRQIADLTGLQLKNAKDLPQQICQPCEDQTLQAHRFRERCIRTQKLFAQQSNRQGEPTTTSNKKLKVKERQTYEKVPLLSIGEQVLADIIQVKVEEKKEVDEEEAKMLPDEGALVPSQVDEKKQKEEIVMPNIAEVLLKGEPIESDSSESGASESDGYNPLDEKNEKSSSMASDYSDESKPLEPTIRLATVEQSVKAKRKARKKISPHGEKIPTKKKMTPKEQLKKEIKPKKEPKRHNLICDQCGKHFKCPRKLEDHLLRHAGEKQHQCKICPQRFYSYQALHRHTRTHSGEKPFGCRFCDRHFMDDSSRVRHERVHTNTRPFVCPQCGKAFTVSPSLKEHMRIHTGERSFVCKICNVSFTLKAHLKTHYRSRTHQQNEEKEQNSHMQTADAATQNKNSSDWQFD